jgi:CheY-like chemotaxis protein
VTLTPINGKVKKILVVDDSADTREMMAKLLELERFVVVTAEDGRVGLDVAESERPDLIITDINMPNLNGLEMITLLRKQSWFTRVPILAITAYGSNIALECGAIQVRSAERGMRNEGNAERFKCGVRSAECGMREMRSDSSAECGARNAELGGVRIQECRVAVRIERSEPF